MYKMIIDRVISFLKDNDVSLNVPGCYALPTDIVYKALVEFIETGDSQLIRKHRDYNYYSWDFEDIKRGRENMCHSLSTVKDLNKFKNLKIFWNDYNDINLIDKLIRDKEREEKIKSEYEYKRKKGFTKALKDECKKRDNYKCVKCSSNKKLEVDHIIPLIKDGKNDLKNLQTLCRKCHRIKTTKDLK